MRLVHLILALFALAFPAGAFAYESAWAVVLLPSTSPEDAEARQEAALKAGFSAVHVMEDNTVLWGYAPTRMEAANAATEARAWLAGIGTRRPEVVRLPFTGQVFGMESPAPDFQPTIPPPAQAAFNWRPLASDPGLLTLAAQDVTTSTPLQIVTAVNAWRLATQNWKVLDAATLNAPTWLQSQDLATRQAALVTLAEAGIVRTWQTRAKGSSRTEEERDALRLKATSLFAQVTGHQDAPGEALAAARYGQAFLAWYAGPADPQRASVASGHWIGALATGLLDAPRATEAVRCAANANRAINREWAVGKVYQALEDSQNVAAHVRVDATFNRLASLLEDANKQAAGPDKTRDWEDLAHVIRAAVQGYEGADFQGVVAGAEWPLAFLRVLWVETLLWSGQFQDAATVAQDSLEKYPGPNFPAALLHYWHGEALEGLEDGGAALAAYQAAGGMELPPDQANYFSGFNPRRKACLAAARLLRETGDVDGATQWSNRALNL